MEDNRLENKNAAPILVELSIGRGEEDVALIGIDKIADASAKAIDKALGTIQSMSERVTKTVGRIPLTERPDTVEIEFGLKLTADSNVYIVGGGIEAQFVVKLSWEQPKEKNQLSRHKLQK